MGRRATAPVTLFCDKNHTFTRDESTLTTPLRVRIYKGLWELSALHGRHNSPPSPYDPASRSPEPISGRTKTQRKVDSPEDPRRSIRPACSRSAPSPVHQDPGDGQSQGGIMTIRTTVSPVTFVLIWSVLVPVCTPTGLAFRSCVERSAPIRHRGSQGTHYPPQRQDSSPHTSALRGWI